MTSIKAQATEAIRSGKEISIHKAVGKVRVGTIGKALWCLYGEGDVNILALTEKSASEYIVSIDGEDVGILTDLA